MTKEQYKLLEAQMLHFISDAAHDKEHVYRVLYNALAIASHETEVNMTVLITACLLHDIGREAQRKDPTLCHAHVGAEMAYQICIEHGVSGQEAEHISRCIASHRYRGDRPPDSIEAKILFDADSLDATGALGIARTLQYQGHMGIPLYETDDMGHLALGTSSFLHEYQYKLVKIYDHFYTQHGYQMALARQQAATEFYHSFVGELENTNKNGAKLLKTALL